MRRRTFVVAAEYSAHPRDLPPSRRRRDFLGEAHLYPDAPDENRRLFFRYPRREAGWAAFGMEEPVGLVDLLASAGHRALCSLHERLGSPAPGYAATRNRIDGLFVTSMPGLDPDEHVNIGLVPQRLRGLLSLPPTCRCQFLVGTSDSGAWAFAEAVRAARTAERPTTLLVIAGQMIPSGYASQYQIRSVLGERDQELGFDMLGAGDLWMDLLRRNHGRSRDDVEALLAAVARRKLEAAALYPAAIRHGEGGERGRRITPYFDATDVAPPCCGAAAVVITADPDLVAQVRGGGRFARPPVLEVLGVGDGSSNPNFLERRSPLLFTPAIRQALASAAADAGLTPAALPACAFGVLHDAFPSIELAFLCSMGFDWEEAVLRMTRAWSNPYGGLLAFGHAIGASGLVQVAKTLHVFAGDRRHVKAAPDPAAELSPPLPAEGALALTTSVGGPLSHIVAALFRGGAAAAERAVDPAVARAHLERWHGQRRRLRSAHAEHLQRLAARPEPLHVVEGTTQVSVRSCLLALDDAAIDRLRFDEVVSLLTEDAAEAARAELRETLRATQDLARSGSRMFDVFDAYHDALSDRVRAWRRAGLLRPEAASRSERELTEQVKASLNAPLLVLASAGPAGVRRSVHVLPLPALEPGPALDAAALIAGDPEGAARILPPEEASPLLPFWHVAASGSEAPTLRRAFALDPGAPGSEAPVSEALLVACCAAEAALDARASEILLGAAERAAGWIAPFGPQIAWAGSGLVALCGARREAGRNLLASIARFALELGHRSARLGTGARIAVRLQEGFSFCDARGTRLYSGGAAHRASQLLDEVPAHGLLFDLAGHAELLEVAHREVGGSATGSRLLVRLAGGNDE